MGSLVSEAALRKAILALAVAGLVLGLGASRFNWLAQSFPWATPQWFWSAGSMPVIIALAISILRDFWIGRFGVDAVALVSMSAALLLGEPLAAVVVAIMYAGGTVLEDFARGRAERDLKALADRSPRIAHRRKGSHVETIPVSEVREGDELLVRAGEMLPVDGELLADSATVDESAVTGEPLPVSFSRGAGLRSGTVNAGEAFAMTATAVAEQSTYAGIVRMVAAAQNVKAPFIRIADRFALFLLPVTLATAWLAWHFSGDPVRGLAVLVTATPCPLILAAPVAFIGGVSRAARAGVLMKGSSALEALAATRTVIFDKTGTLTVGGAMLIASHAARGRDIREVLRLAASLEQASHHVVSDAFIAAAREKGLALAQPADVRESRGSGITGMVDGVEVSAGSRHYVTAGRALPAWARSAELNGEAKAALKVFVSLDGRLAGLFLFGDALRSDASAVVSSLRAHGVGRIVMLTGDDAATAREVGSQLGLDAIIADASPSDKVATVQAETHLATCAMVGDGINDAPALASASVGIAMGARGATASSEAADVIILPDRLYPVADAIRIARRARGIAMQSIVAGLVLSGLAMVAAAFGYVTPVAGALIQEGIDVAVILNALRALGDGFGSKA